MSSISSSHHDEPWQEKMVKALRRWFIARSYALWVRSQLSSTPVVRSWYASQYQQLADLFNLLLNSCIYESIDLMASVCMFTQASAAYQSLAFGVFGSSTKLQAHKFPQKILGFIKQKKLTFSFSLLPLFLFCSILARFL